MSNLRITPITKKKREQEELRITPILTEEEKKQQIMSQSKVMVPAPQVTMTQNNINNKIAKNIVSGGIQKDIHTLNMAKAMQPINNKIDLSGKNKIGQTSSSNTAEFKYKDTGKKYGDYYYDNYEQYKDMPIYEQQGKYYLKTNRGYEPIGRLDKNGNVAQNVITTKEAEKEELEKAKKLGYKDNITKITTQDYDNAQDTFKRLQKEYKLSDKELNNWIKTGDLPIHVSIQTNSMSSLKNKAEDYREKINSGKIKQYNQQGFNAINQLDIDLQNMSDEEKQHYISSVTGKKDPTLKKQNTFFKSSESNNPIIATLGTIGNAGYSFLKGTGKFVEGTSDFVENLIGSGLESFASDKDKKDVKEFHNNTWNIGYKYGNQNYWYDEKNDRLYDENWNRVYNFDLSKLEKRYTYSNGVAEFGRQMKEQTTKDDTGEVFDEILHGNDLRKMSVLGNKSEAMLESLGQAIPLMGAGGSVGGLYGEGAAVATTSGLTFASTYGKAKEEAIRNGATEKEAMQTAFVQATAETISEQFFDAIPGAKSAGWGEKLVGKVGNSVEKYMGSRTAKIVTKVLDISGEGFEEIISNMLTAGGNDIVHFFDKDYSYGMENQTGNILDDMSKAMVSQDSMDSFVSAIITSALLNGGSAKVNSFKTKQIIKAYAQEYNMPIEEAKARLKISDDGIEFDTSNINQTQNIPNLPNNSAVEQRNINNNINNQVNENIENSMARTQNSNKVNPPISTTFLNSAKQNNYNSNSEVIRNANSIMLKRGIEGKFDSKFFTNNSESAIWHKDKKGKRSVIFNPNADENTIFQNVIIHEMVHDVLSSKNSADVLNVEDIFDFVSKTSGYKSARMNLEETYSKVYDKNSEQFKEMVDEEVITTVLGNKLGNQEYINRLNRQKPNLARRIYNWIVNKLDSLSKALGHQSEKAYWRDVANRFEKAFNGEYNSDLNDNTKYMMTSVKGINNGINTDNKYLDIKKRYDKAQKLKDSGLYSNEDIRQETGWFQDKEGNWEFEISDHNNDFKINPQPNTKYKMSNLFEAKTLYDLYPGLKDINVIFKKLPKHKSGNYNMETNEITINNNNLDNIDDIRGTLLHEMQHYIQKVEGLPRGTTILFGNEQYANSKGEIEAADTKRRMKMSVKERKQIIPESSKKNPIHPNRANILNHKRGIIEKIAEKMYNKFGVDTNENIEEEAKENYSKTDNKNFNTYQKYKNGIEELDNSSFSLKEKQLEIIKKNNPVEDDYHTWIRNIDDIKTLSETLEDSDWEGYDEFNPDLTRQDILEAIDNGEIMVYSSYPIGQGTFISPSKMEAESYSGNGKVYSKKVSIDDVAWIDPTQGQYAKVENERYSQKSQTWDEFVENNFKSSGTRTKFSEIKAPIKKAINGLSEDVKQLQESINETKKIMDPLQISNLTKENASTTPKLPKVERNSLFADKESSFYSNITEKSKFITKENRELISTDEDVQFYDGITNEDTLNTAFKQLQDGGSAETYRWFKQDSKKATAIDVAEGWILLKHYQDVKDYSSMVEVAKKMREIGTNAGQTVQAFNILARLTPEGMVKYAQSELLEAFEIMSKDKTKKWIDNNREQFDLTPDEVQFIVDNMNDITTLNQDTINNNRIKQLKEKFDKTTNVKEKKQIISEISKYQSDIEYSKKVKLAEIQKIITDKLPVEGGKGIKAWMRISMLFNPKTQVRNVMGNALIAPVNYFGDMFGSLADKIVAKKTGVRTTGMMNSKAIIKGLKDGAYQSTNDFKKGINTRDMEGNRFEIGEGKSFSDKRAIGRSLNRVDHLLNYAMDIGDRVFSQASFENSLQNQMILNNTVDVTQEMIDIARQESLQRTWNDNNEYTKFVLDVRRMLNKIGTANYGLGDVLIPFAKTPANLTKAIVDYSPVGLVKALNSGIKLKRSLSNGQYNVQMQHKFVQDLGKATAGTMLYIIGYALAKAGVITGKSDDDKDVANFMKNTLGISNYSIKIGGMTFTYDWAQPLAAPLSITADIVQKKKEGLSLHENILSSLNTAGNILLEQSFLESLNTVFSNNEGVVTGLEESIFELPSRAVPTFMKQIVDMTDGTQRQTFEKNKPFQSAINKVKAKIPGLSYTIAPSVDTMGRDIKKYGGKNNWFNVFFNPANVNTENISESAKEIYRVYKATDNKEIFPRVSPYSIDKVPLSTEQRTKYQKISGKMIDEAVGELIESNKYKKLSEDEKVEVIKNIVSYSTNYAKSKVLKTEIGKNFKNVNKYYNHGGSIAEYYLHRVGD